MVDSRLGRQCILGIPRLHRFHRQVGHAELDSQEPFSRKTFTRFSCIIANMKNRHCLALLGVDVLLTVTREGLRCRVWRCFAL